MNKITSSIDLITQKRHQSYINSMSKIVILSLTPWRHQPLFCYTHKVGECIFIGIFNSFNKDKQHLYTKLICVPVLTCSALMAGAEYVRWRTSMLFSSRLSSSKYDSHSSKSVKVKERLLLDEKFWCMQ